MKNFQFSIANFQSLLCVMVLLLFGLPVRAQLTTNAPGFVGLTYTGNTNYSRSNAVASYLPNTNSAQTNRTFQYVPITNSTITNRTFQYTPNTNDLGTNKTFGYGFSTNFSASNVVATASGNTNAPGTIAGGSGPNTNAPSSGRYYQVISLATNYMVYTNSGVQVSGAGTAAVNGNYDWAGYVGGSASFLSEWFTNESGNTVLTNYSSGRWRFVYTVTNLGYTIYQSSSQYGAIGVNYTSGSTFGTNPVPTVTTNWGSFVITNGVNIVTTTNLLPRF